MLPYIRFLLFTLVMTWASPAFANGSLPFSDAPVTAMGHKPMGMHLPQSPWFIEKIDAMEDKLGRSINVVHWFGSWEYEFEALPFENVLASARVPLFTWQPLHESPKQISQGYYDTYLRTYARSMAELEGEVIIRYMPEMNGFWEPWNGDPEGFVAAWRHTVKLFREEGASNVLWMWAPNITDSPVLPENQMELYYPGDDVVDLLGLSGYNWGQVQATTAWKSFEETFQQPYDRLLAIADKPIWIAEIASVEQGGDKANWVRNMLASEAFPKIASFVWFQEKKEADWRIDSSPETLLAFRNWAVIVER